MSRLNSGIKNRYNFFIHVIFFISDYWNWLSKSRWIRGYQKFDLIPWEFGFGIFAQILKLRGWRQNAWVIRSQNHL